MAMDFFDAQDRAQRQTGKLVALFVCAVVLIVLAINGVFAAAAFAVAAKNPKAMSKLVGPELFVAVTLVTIGIIVCCTLYKYHELGAGGAPVARMLGARRVLPNTLDTSERRLLNVVEEISIASGCPMPQVYVLHDERAINCCAAGNSPSDAVVCVTKGALLALNREELQGLIAHDFSHMLNGDMRLNLKLIGVLHGILALAMIGYFLMRTMGESRSSRKEGGAYLAILGLGIMCVGYIGVFFARLIKSAIARQREYLADAAAVQFTRNPEGVAGALRKMGGVRQGSRIRAAGAEEVSHMFFGPAVGATSGPTATHPMLGDRIRRVLPTWDGAFPRIELPEDDGQSGAGQGHAERAKRAARASAVESIVGGGATRIPLAPIMALASIGAPGEQHMSFAQDVHDQVRGPLRAALNESFGARAVVLALLVDSDPAVRTRQLAYLDQTGEAGLRLEVEKLRADVVSLGPSGAVPLVEMALPALREQSVDQYFALMRHVKALVEADGRTSLFELALEQMLARHLAPTFQPQGAPKIKYPAMAGVRAEIALVLSAVARVGTPNLREAQDAFAKAVTGLALGAAVAMLPPEQCTPDALRPALDKLGETSPAIKRRVLGAIVEVVAADGHVTIGEAEIVRAISDALGCPMPPLVGNAVSA